MKIKLLLAAIFTLSTALLLFSEPLIAAESTYDDSKVIMQRKKILDENRTKPLQNPYNERSEEIIKRRVTDSKNKVIGEVKDILFNEKGNITSVYVDFNRLNMGGSVHLNRDNMDMKNTSSGYKLGFSSDEIEEIYPSLLSGIETATGSPDDGERQTIFSLNNILGSAVVDNTGRSLGRLEDVLFDKNGAYVRSAYLNINYQTIHNKGVAVPLSALSFEQKYGKTQIVIDTPYIEPILELARKN